MALTEKTITLFALESQLETVYGDGGGGFVPADDGILLAERVEVPISYSHGGERGAEQPGTGGLYARTAPSGRFTEFPVTVQFRGAGIAYSATETPQDIHEFLLMSGHEATGDFTVSTENYQYDPESSGFDSGALRGFARGQQIDATGVYSSMAFSIDGPGPMTFEFTNMGLVAIPVDAAIPGTLAFQNPTLKPPKSENIILTINAVTGFVARSLSFNQNRDLGSRVDINQAAGFAGFAAGRREPSMEVVMEARALATFDPYTLRDAGTEFAMSFVIGSVQYNTMTFLANHAQIINVSEDDDGPVAIWTLELILASNPGVNDEYKITVD